MYGVASQAIFWFVVCWMKMLAMAMVPIRRRSRTSNRFLQLLPRAFSNVTVSDCEALSLVETGRCSCFPFALLIFHDRVFAWA